MEQLRVTVSVFGRFHAFDLARQLHQAGGLAHLITSYPKWIAGRWNLPAGKIDSLLWLELLSRAWSAVPPLRRARTRVQPWLCERFDRAASRLLSPSSNVFVGWSSFSLFSLRKAKSLGMRTVIERGASHIRVQTRILEEEYSRWGLRFNGTAPAVEDRELQEYAEADRIAVPSLFVKETFMTQGMDAQKLMHLPYGVSLEEFYPVPKKDHVFRVLHCGSLGLQKGIPYLLQAFNELDLPGAELWLVGAMEPEMHALIGRYRNEKIVFKGTHPQKTLRWFYSQCSVLCLASVQDGFGMVIPQAMACGLPVIHTTNTGGRDIVDDGIHGFEVPIRDMDALKEKILYLYENPEAREEMGRQARARAVKALSWERYGQLALAAFRDLLGDQSVLSRRGDARSG